VLSAEFAKRRSASPAPPPALLAGGGSSSALVSALIALLFALPGLALLAAFVPPWALPSPRQKALWAERRLEVGVFAASILLVEAVLAALLA